MKKCFFAVVVASGLVMLSSGCGKNAADTSKPASETTFNAVQFFQDFASAPPAQKTLADKAWVSIQSGAFPAALKCLDKLAADPSLNDSQKKSAVLLSEQVKKQMALNNAAR